MPDPVAIVCPHCDGKLKLKDRSKLGSKILCPKCKKPFKATERVDDEDEFAAFDDGSMEEEEEEAPRSRRAASGKKSGGKKRKGKSSGNNLLFIIAGVAVLLLIGGGMLVRSFLGGGDQPAPVADAALPAVPPAGAAPAVPPAAAPAAKSIDFAWLPPQVEAVAYVRPADLLKSGFAQWVMDATGSREQVTQQLQAMRQEKGVNLEEIESLTIGIKQVEDLQAGAGGIVPGAMPDPLQVAMGLSELAQKEIVGVARLSKPSEITTGPGFQQLTEAVNYKSKTYYRDKGSKGQPGGNVIYLPAPNIVVVCGREDVMKSLIDREGKAEPRPELEILDPTQHLTFATLVKPAMSAGIPDGEIPPGAAAPAVNVSAFKKVKSVAIGIKATDGLEVSMRQLGGDATSAEALLTTTNNMVSATLLEYRASMTGWPKTLAQLGERLLANVKSTRRDLVVETVTAFPASARDSLKAIPGEVFAAMMTSSGPSTVSIGDQPDFPLISGGGFQSSDEADDHRGKAVTVDKLAGLPPGMTLRGRAGWMKDPDFKPEGATLPPRLMIFDIEIAGEVASKTVSVGNMQINKLVAEPQQNLKLTEHPNALGEGVGNPFKEFVATDRLGLGFFRPNDCIQARLFFDHPAVPPAKITLLEGTLTLKVARETKSILVPDVLQQAGKPATDPDLKAAGFAVVTKNENGRRQSEISFESTSSVAGVKLVGANGARLNEAPFVMRSNMSGFPSWGFSEEGKPIEGMAANVTLHTKMDEVTVPFRFENVEVKPSLDTPYVAGVDWKPSTSKGLPPGLAVDGRVRWEPVEAVVGETPPPRLLLEIDVTGTAARQVAATGFFKLAKTTTNSGGPLKMEPDYQSDHYSVADHRYGITHYPPNGATVVMTYANNPKSFTSIESTTGSFKMQLAASEKVTRIEKIASQLGKPVSTPELQKEGLEFKFAVKDNKLEVALTKGDGFAVVHTGMVRGARADQELKYEGYDPGIKSGSIDLGTYPLKPDDAVEITYYTGMKEVEIPFAFEKLTVPAKPKPMK